MSPRFAATPAPRPIPIPVLWSLKKSWNSLVIKPPVRFPDSSFSPNNFVFKVSDWLTKEIPAPSNAPPIGPPGKNIEPRIPNWLLMIGVATAPITAPAPIFPPFPFISVRKLSNRSLALLTLSPILGSPRSIFVHSLNRLFVCFQILSIPSDTIVPKGLVFPCSSRSIPR